MRHLYTYICCLQGHQLWKYVYSNKGCHYNLVLRCQFKVEEIVVASLVSYEIALTKHNKE